MIRNFKHFTTLIFLLGLSFYSFSQSGLLNAENPSDIGFEKPSQSYEEFLEYGYVDDKDILFSTMVWETIDVSQKVNFPYLYPVEMSLVGDERRPLLYFIREAINYELTADKLFDDSNFNSTLNAKDIDRLWREKKVLDPEGTKSQDNKWKFIDDNLKKNTQISEKSIFPYDYSEYDETLEQRINISFTEEDFKAFYNTNYNNRGGLGQDFLDPQGNPLSDNKKDLYNRVINEIVEDLWIEGEHFVWTNFNYEDVVEWRIKGLWYFDKIQSELKYRLIGIAPVANPIGAADKLREIEMQKLNNGGSSSNEETCYDIDGYPVNCDGSEGLVTERVGGSNTTSSASTQEIQPTFEPRELFWIYYPHLRDVLSTKRDRKASDGKKSRMPVVFSERNSSVRKTYDHLLNSRRFHSVIYLEENNRQNINLNDLYPESAFMRLLESNRIKEKVRNLEHDMWSW